MRINNVQEEKKMNLPYITKSKDQLTPDELSRLQQRKAALSKQVDILEQRGSAEPGYMETAAYSALAGRRQELEALTKFLEQ